MKLTEHEAWTQNMDITLRTEHSTAYLDQRGMTDVH